MASASDKLIKRLSSYWQLEAFNAVFIPAVTVFISRGSVGWLTVIACVPMVLLLIIGAIYWREKLLKLKTPSHNSAPKFKLISLLQVPSLALTLGAAGIVLYAWVSPNWQPSPWDLGAATFAVVLAILEYINYYHRQLQHFDHIADFKRLLAGKGFRRSQMAKDLATYRAAKR